MNLKLKSLHKGFTIVELLIVIVVIAVLAAITVVAYDGIQARARDSRIRSDLANVRRLVEAYYAENGSYPVTSSSLFVDYTTETARTDENCTYGDSRSDWIPSVGTLPQSVQGNAGARGTAGCYIYLSNGSLYILSAWNMLEMPQNTATYRRVGFREANLAQTYLCNHPNVGAASPAPYTIANDHYKYSYTFSNLTTCNETPPAGA